MGDARQQPTGIVVHGDLGIAKIESRVGITSTLAVRHAARAKLDGGKILSHLGLPTELPIPAAARAPPQQDFDRKPPPQISRRYARSHDLDSREFGVRARARRLSHARFQRNSRLNPSEARSSSTAS